MRSVIGYSLTGIAVGLGSVVGATRALAMGPPSLPTTFAGEAFTVAFAFALPALLAGFYLLAKTILARLTLQRAFMVATLTIAGGFAWAVLENRPDLISTKALLALAGG